MSNTKNIFMPKFWAGISLLLLSIFLGYWNYSNFENEKFQLKQNLETQLQLAFAEVEDSVLIDELTIHTKMNYHEVSLEADAIHLGSMNKDIPYDSLEHEMTIIDLNENPDYRDSFQIYTFSKQMIENFSIDLKIDSLSDYTNKDHSLTHITIDDDKNKDTRNVKILFDQWLSSRSNYNEDVIALYTQKVKKLGLPSEHIAVSDTSKREELLIEYKVDEQFTKPLTLQTINYSGYLWNSIFPSLAFSLLLLGIVSLAFWSLLSSWIKQQRLIEVKNEFISNMTHELKTPISTVGVALEAISGFDLSQEEEKTKEYIDISRHELNRLSLLVDKVLKMASYTEDNQEMKKEVVNLSALTSKITRSMKLRLKEKNAILNYSNESISSNIDADPIHISNVIYNIIDNGLKYSTDSPQLNIHLTESNGSLCLRIDDNGPGIPREHLSKIFDRFYRVPNKDRHNVKGHGLGLSYVKDVITKHRGTITAESKLGAGTSFVIILPKIDQYV